MGFFQRALLLYLCIAIAITFAAPSVIFVNGGAAGNTVLSWFNIECSGSCTDSSQVSLGNSTLSNNTGAAGNSFSTPTSPAQSQGILGFIDPIFQVFSWVILIFKVLFSPMILLSSTAFVGAPAALMFVIGIPLVFMFIVGLIIWIRSGFP